MIDQDSSLEQLRRAVLCLFGFREDFPYHLRFGEVSYSEDWVGEEKSEDLEEVDLADIPLREAIEAIKGEKGHKKHIFYHYKSPSGVRLIGEDLFIIEVKDKDFSGYANWDIAITYEGELPAEENRYYPVCIAGGRASPPREIPDHAKYQWFINTLKSMGRSRLIQALKREDDLEDRDYISLLESGFDPAVFDRDSVNRCLAEVGKK